MGVISAISDLIQTDYLVVGAGVAGLRAAIALAPAGRVLVVAKDSLRESSSEYAQGGIAVALSDDDEVDLHESDTLAAGDGLCNREAVHVLVEEGPAAIQQLMDWGAEFDKEGGRLVFAREGAHSRSRVLHSHGDSTGKEIARTLYHKAASLENVSFRSFSAVVDLLVQDGRVVGAVALDENTGSLIPISAKAVLLATGGLGRVFTDTTNPDVATGDGVAMGWRAGATISDIEFIQFHPTALHIEGAPRFLLSEALRGEGAHLLNAKGERFMRRYHEMAELAPRDVVSRCIVEEMRREKSPHVFLDLSGRGPGFVKNRFPRIYTTCLEYGIDLDKEPAPVHPAAHYSMGGVWTDLDGRTSSPGLWAAGEVACTGVHGANRLASNSLLEGVVFGARAGQSIVDSDSTARLRGVRFEPLEIPQTKEAIVRRIATDFCGIIRNGDGLTTALTILGGMPASRKRQVSRADIEVANIHTLTQLIARCARAREESRGAHRRSDYPKRVEAFEKHSRIRISQREVTFE
ncbi:L-aspartate oxidase [Paludibaculum fermentans]|uniref:L-aspartate oxidase n=1 Tax=Paludibaculum fermentans TaxID=1473598 RepID=A0A7S7SHD3_PALFE|nr:L-aspartate oxidase [Paludibaculum fermentans]